MWDFSIGQAIGLMARTASFGLVRVIVYFGVAIALILITGTGVGHGVGTFGDDAFRSQSTAWGAMGGFGLTVGVLFFFRDDLLYLIKAVRIEPFAIACMIQAFFKVPAGQTPNPEWKARLARGSDKFNEIGNRAMNWARRGFGATSASRQER